MRRSLSRSAPLGMALAVLLSGAGGPARAADDDDLPKDLPKEHRQHLQHMMKQMEMMRKMMEQQRAWMLPGGPGAAMLGRFGERGAVREPRLGADLRGAGDTLADQLDLPRDQGVVLEEVGANSAAARAGLKKHDVLLELNGKAVPRKLDAFGKLLAEVKPDAPVDAVVMRKGKKETIKGLKLPEARAALPPAGALVPNFPNFPGAGPLAPGVQGDQTTVTRTDDQFTARHSDGRTTVTVKGSVEDGKAKVRSVTIDGGASGKKEFAGVDELPADVRKRVQKLTDLAVGGKENVKP